MPAKLVYRYSENPEVTIIIPSLDGDRKGNVERLLHTFKEQDFKNIEIILSIAEYPNGHARNVGFSLSHPESRYLLFFDDDVALDDSAVVSRFVSALRDNREFGLVGALIKRPPTQDGFFMRWIEREGGRHVVHDVSEYTESNMVCHAGLGIRREVWIEVGGESSSIPTGTDTDLRIRIRKAGYKVILIPHTKVYHPFPETPREMWVRTWEHGLKHHLFRRVHPDALDEACSLVDSPAKAYGLIAKSAVKAIPHIFVDNKLRFRFRPVNAVNSLLFHLGYALGWLRGRSKR